MSMDNYTKITWPEVRAGDVLMHDNGDRLTVEDHNTDPSLVLLKVIGSWRFTTWFEQNDFTPYRRKPEMPSEPGAYLDKDGEVVVLKIVEGVLSWDDGNFWQSEADMEHLAPFTRLVPMPTREQVLQTITSYIGSEVQADAVMALLAGKEAGA